MIKALKSLTRCHVATILLDAAEGVSEQDARICGYAFEQGRGVVLAVNKWDLIKGNAQKRKKLDDEIDRQLKFISFAPKVNLSALTGERVMKLFEKIDLLYEQFSRRISTGALNRAIQEMIKKHPPPRIGQGRLKFFYATQARTRPPTFVIFVNRPDTLHFSYKRFLINQLRTNFQLEFTPINLIFRKK
jgi:GTP-binding protein